MLNREKYAKEILDMACSGNSIAKVDGKITPCIGGCIGCDFYNGSGHCCRENVREWANSECVEPPVDWSKVAVDTPILVRDSEEEAWRKRHFAKYENGIVYAWSGGSTHWSVRRSSNISDWAMAKLAESEE